MQGKINKLKPHQYPAFLKHPSSSSSVYQLDEWIIDCPSLIAAFYRKFRHRIIQAQPIFWDLDSPTAVVDLQLANQPKQKITIKAAKVVLCAGRGNSDFLHANRKIKMQTRPLHMAMVKHAQLPTAFAHLIDGGKRPKLTISSHLLGGGKKEQNVWYLGGSLAENGVGQSISVLLSEAYKLLSRLFPNLPWHTAQWASVGIARAEAKQGGRLGLPLGCFVQNNSRNSVVCWPSKLVRAPELASQVLNLLNGKLPPSRKNVGEQIHQRVQQNLTLNLPTASSPLLSSYSLPSSPLASPPLTSPPLALPPWQQANWQSADEFMS